MSKFLGFFFNHSPVPWDCYVYWHTCSLFIITNYNVWFVVGDGSVSLHLLIPQYSGTCSYQWFLPNCTPVSLHMLKCSRALTLSCLFMYSSSSSSYIIHHYHHGQSEINDNFLEGVGVNKTFCTLWYDLTSGSSEFATATHVVSQAIIPFPRTSSSVRFSDRTLVGTFCYEQ
jgi:hypothetical protein